MQPHIIITIVVAVWLIGLILARKRDKTVDANIQARKRDNTL